MFDLDDNKMTTMVDMKSTGWGWKVRIESG